MSSLPYSCGIALKEWAGVCEALMQGRQTIILRKGGISEGPGGFTPEHRFFWMYPTHVHQAEQGLRLADGDAPRDSPLSPSDPVPIQALAAVELIHHVDTEETLRSLTPLHIWTEETIRKRFHYRQPGLWVLGVRLFRRAKPMMLAPTLEQLGCKSWVDLTPPLTTEGLQSVLEEDDWTERLQRLQLLLSRERGGF
jgi:hypothetical protein